MVALIDDKGTRRPVAGVRFLARAPTFAPRSRINQPQRSAPRLHHVEIDSCFERRISRRCGTLSRRRCKDKDLGCVGRRDGTHDARDRWVAV